MFIIYMLIQKNARRTDAKCSVKIKGKVFTIQTKTKKLATKYMY